MEHNFKNEATADIVNWLLKYRPEFNARKKGQAFRQIIFAVANFIPEDRNTIQEVFMSKRKTRRNMVTGKAKITRYRGLAKNVVKGCADCPDSQPIEVSDHVQRKFVKSAIEEKFASAEDVMTRFEGDADMMKDYAQKNSVNVGKASKPETLAEKIFEHFNKPEDSE